MRRPRLFLGIFALALLLPLLLLACGGSDEPTDGPSQARVTAEPTDLPDSERATDEPETPASLDGRLPRQGQGTRPRPPLRQRRPRPPAPSKRTGKPWLPSTTQRTVITGMKAPTGSATHPSANGRVSPPTTTGALQSCASSATA